ncbi:protein BPS1, chloroplastic [Cryptomeria japonica]|uniref:protein BPS1, chloroplastic n=1 Tax=Cryptomeria japonica TaxID=3369 RepID=UPI0027DA7F24|nr:protein BPS1, chloroplastic [Cryptomeria japonica]
MCSSQGLQYVQGCPGQVEEKRKKEMMQGLQFVQSFQGLEYGESFHDQPEEKGKKEIISCLQEISEEKRKKEIMSCLQEISEETRKNEIKGFKKSQSFSSLLEEKKKKEIMGGLQGFQRALSFHGRKMWKKEIMGSMPNLQIPRSFAGLSKEKLKKEIKGGWRRLQYAQSFQIRTDKRKKETTGGLQGLQYALSFQDRPSSSTKNSAIDADLEIHLCAELQRLQEFGNYLSAGWLRQALDLCLSMHREVQAIFPQIGQNSKWMDETLDDMVKLLDVCNALRVKMRDMKEYQEKLHLVLHCFNGPLGTWQLVRARTALSNLSQSAAKAQSISLMENCSSILRRMSEKRVASSAGGRLMEPIFAAKDLTIFICGLLIAALSSKSRCSLPLPCAGHSPWASDFQALYFKVKKEVERRSKKGTFRAFLNELHKVDSSSQALYDLLVNCKSILVDETQDLELRHSVMCLKNSIAELEDGMAPIEIQINELFRVVVADRMALLDALTYSS